MGRAICELLTYTTAVLSGLLCTFHLFRAEKILAPDPEDDSGTSALDVSGVAKCGKEKMKQKFIWRRESETKRTPPPLCSVVVAGAAALPNTCDHSTHTPAVLATLKSQTSPKVVHLPH